MQPSSRKREMPRRKYSWKPTHPLPLTFMPSYLIRDRKSGAVLFLGRMLNPSGLAD